MKRIFIVGIARSGTTLLQSFIGNHPDISTFPETHFFSVSLHKKKLFRALNYVTNKDKEFVEKFFQENDLLDVYQGFKGSVFGSKQWTKYLLGLLDQIAISEGNECWLEKTPMHLYYVDLLESLSDDVLFIHTIREPKSNIAALYDVSKKHPDAFKQNTLEKSIERYKREVNLSQSYLGKQNHVHVYYEDLVTNPRNVIEMVFKRLNMSFTEAVYNFQNNVNQIVSEGETWKSNNSNELKLKNKLADRLTTSELQFLESKLQGYSPSLLERYEEN